MTPPTPPLKQNSAPPAGVSEKSSKKTDGGAGCGLAVKVEMHLKLKMDILSSREKKEILERIRIGQRPDYEEL